MLESAVEKQFKRLGDFGFKVLKFKTPGHSGTMDRLILWPTWSPAPPVMVEAKRPGKTERALQVQVRDGWRARGCDVRDMCDTIEKVQLLCDQLLYECVQRASGSISVFPDHVVNAYAEACKRLDYAGA